MSEYTTWFNPNSTVEEMKAQFEWRFKVKVVNAERGVYYNVIPYYVEGDGDIIRRVEPMHEKVETFKNVEEAKAFCRKFKYAEIRKMEDLKVTFTYDAEAPARKPFERGEIVTRERVSYCRIGEAETVFIHNTL